MEFVKAIKEFNTTADNTGEYNERKVGLYTGLVLEEVGEMLESFGDDFEEVTTYLHELSTKFKAGQYDGYISEVDREAYLDAAVDIAVVSLGGGIAIGSDIEGACNEVMNTNLAKFPIVDGVRTIIKDSNGKVKKPEGWKGPELNKFLK